MEIATPGRRRRIHSAEFKARAVEACKQPGVSMASVALANGINANLLRRWTLEAGRSPRDAVSPRRMDPPGFIALPMAAPPIAAGEPVRIELQRGSTKIAVTWPVSAADSCAAWLRELLR
jgi:transposase